MSNTEIINEEPVDTGPQTSEDKFFGVTTEINTDSTDEIEVRVVEDSSEDRSPKKAKNSPVDDDDVDEEIANYSQRAADRINQVKYEYHEQRRAKETSEKIAEEAATRLQTVMHENQRLQQMVEQGGNVLNQTAYNNALWAKQAATEQYKKAYDEGDAESMAKAQELLSKATFAEQQAGTTAQQVQNQIAEAMPQIQERVGPKKQLDPDMDKWARKNPWFMGQEAFQQEMTSYALAWDVRLRNQGILPETRAEEYYDAVDNAMRKEFPSFFGVQAGSDSEMVTYEGTPKRQPQTVVASATRDSGNKKPTQIHLNKAQVALARQLGITPEQYANQLLKEA